MWFIYALGMAALNCVRGGGEQTFGRIGMAVLTAVYVGYSTQSIRLGALAAAAQLVFFLQPWGRWYTLGKHPRDLAGAPSWYERRLESLNQPDATTWYVSASIFAIPAILVGAFHGSIGMIGMPIALVTSYAFAWHMFVDGEDNFPIRAAEFIFGLMLAVVTIITY